MAKHRARTRGMRRTCVAIGSGLAILLVPQAAWAGAGAKVLTVSNQDVTARCAFEVKSVNPSTLETTIKLSGQAQPVTAAGYGNNVFTQVNCWVLPAGQHDPMTALAEIHLGENRPIVLNTSTLATIPFGDSYRLCGSAFVKLANGDTRQTTYDCT